MAEQADAEDRTEAATGRRLQQAREEGRVAVSRELVTFATLGAAALVLAMLAPAAAHSLAVRLVVFLDSAGRIDLADGGTAALRAAGLAALEAAAPFVLAGLFAGAAMVLLQTGFLFNLSALSPDFARLNPLAGLRRLVGPANLVEAGKSLLKVAILSVVLWRTLAGDLGDFYASLDWEPAQLGSHIARQMLHVLLAVLVVQAAIAIGDVTWERLRHARSLRMSREEIREEHRETDGDPRVKGRLRQIRQMRARRRILAAVPKAAVVITNPTHYAVALAYERGRNAAPRVVAKGVDTMAARIREAAAAHGVPIVANPPLARALHQVKLDTDIPPEHYQAVAEIIAYVWRLGQRAAPPGRQPVL